MKENIRILLKFTVGLAIILFGTFFLSMILFFAWILGDSGCSDYVSSIKWLWKGKNKAVYVELLDWIKKWLEPKSNEFLEGQKIRR